MAEGIAEEIHDKAVEDGLQPVTGVLHLHWVVSHHPHQAVLLWKAHDDARQWIKTDSALQEV